MTTPDERPRSKFGRSTADGYAFWWVDRLWVLSAQLPPFRLAIDRIAEFDMDCWFEGQKSPTCRAVARHARRIAAVDLSYPVILDTSGALMDGAHRVAKAWTQDQDWVLAVQFETDPEPDWTDKGSARP